MGISIQPKTWAASNTSNYFRNRIPDPIQTFRAMSIGAPIANELERKLFGYIGSDAIGIQKLSISRYYSDSVVILLFMFQP